MGETGYESRRTSEGQTKERSFRLKLPATLRRGCTLEYKMANSEHKLFVWGDDFEVILDILEEDDEIEEHFTSTKREISLICANLDS